jgi:hypothetical protein
MCRLSEVNVVFRRYIRRGCSGASEGRSDSIDVPSYAVPSTPFMTALQCITSSSAGPRSRSSAFGSFW